MRDDQLLDQLRRHEGERLAVYQDSLGFLTIGMGRMIDSRKGGGISHEEAMMLLHNDVVRATNAVCENLLWAVDLDMARFAVLVNMAFQLGIGGLLKFQNTLHSVQVGNYEEASNAMLQSLWARQTPARAKELAEQMRTGQWRVK